MLSSGTMIKPQSHSTRRTAEGDALAGRGGAEAMQLRIGEEYLRQFGKIAKESTTLIVPGQLSDLASVVAMATSIIRKTPPAQA